MHNQQTCTYAVLVWLLASVFAPIVAAEDEPETPEQICARTLPKRADVFDMATCLEDNDAHEEAAKVLERFLEGDHDEFEKGLARNHLALLKTTPAQLTIRSVPSEALVIIDDGNHGQTPAAVEVKPGSHLVAVQKKGFQTLEKTVELDFGEKRELVFELKEKASPAQAEEAFGVGKTPYLTEDLPGNMPDSREPMFRRSMWISIGVASFALVAGTVLGFLALSEESKFEETPTTRSADRAERLSLYADASFVAAGLSGISACVFYLLKRRELRKTTPSTQPSARLQIEPLLSPDRLVIDTTVRF